MVPLAEIEVKFRDDHKKRQQKEKDYSTSISLSFADDQQCESNCKFFVFAYEYDQKIFYAPANQKSSIIFILSTWLIFLAT